MAQSTEDKKTPVSFQLKTTKNVRTTLARIFRLRFNNVIDSTMCRDLVLVARGMLDHDKHILESDMDKRIERIEALVRGEGGTVIEQSEIDSPYAVSLKKQLVNESKINSQLNNEILNLKRRLAENRAASTDTESVGVA
jgi:hypothetical protein